MKSLGKKMTAPLLAFVLFEVILFTEAAENCQCGKYQYCRSGGSGCGDCTDICESKKPDYNWDLCKVECLGK